jgi:hypothetical protein
MIPPKMMSEIPFPIPFSLILSPIHMTIADPAVRAKITVIALKKLKFLI